MNKEVNYEDCESVVLLSNDKSTIVENYVKQFVKKTSKILPQEKKLEKLRVSFVEDFTLQKILSMTKEEYVVGLESKSSFCYRLETELQGLGDIHGSNSVKFGLWFGKNGQDTELKYRPATRFGNDVEQAFKEIKQNIYFLLVHGNIKDIDAIRQVNLSPMFRGKILATYYPEEYLCIFSDDHLKHFVKSLGIELAKNADIFDKQIALMEWKNQQPELKELSNHMFSLFLYEVFGRPLESKKAAKEKQELRDSQYPKDYVTEIGVTVKQWKALLEDSNVFKEEDITLLKRFYLSDNHATTCHDLSIQDGVKSSSYISPVVALARRISKALDLPPIIGDEGKPVWWRIPFWGSYREDTHFEWKLRPELAAAMEDVFSVLNKNAEIAAEEKTDEKLISTLKTADLSYVKPVEYNAKPKKKSEPTYVGEHKVFARDEKTAINALAHANFLCEINPEHPTFIRRKSGKNYTEPHHLVPMAYQDDFEVSLDREANIVSLCSNCHNQIHYGEGSELLIKHLYKERKELLESVGIIISLEELLIMYGF